MDENRRRQIEEEEAYRLQVRQAETLKTGSNNKQITDQHENDTLIDERPHAQPERNLERGIQLDENRRRQIREEESYRDQIRQEINSRRSDNKSRPLTGNSVNQTNSPPVQEPQYNPLKSNHKYSTGIWTSIVCPGSGMLWVGMANWFFVYFLIYAACTLFNFASTLLSQSGDNSLTGVAGAASVISLIIFVVQFFHYTSAYRQRFPT